MTAVRIIVSADLEANSLDVDIEVDKVGDDLDEALSMPILLGLLELARDSVKGSAGTVAVRR